jgi:hypothetical protein
MILLGMFMIMLGVIVFYSSDQVTSYIDNSNIGSSAKSIAMSVNQVVAGGPGTMKIVSIELSKGVRQVYTSRNEILYLFESDGLFSDIHFPTKTFVYGFLESGSGRRFIISTAEKNGYVSLAPLSAPNITKSIVGFYNFEIRNSTHIDDGSGKNNPGLLVGGVLCNNPGYIGWGCELNQSMYIDFLNNDLINFNKSSFTISLWVNPYENIDSIILSKWNYSGNNKQYILESYSSIQNKAVFKIGDGLSNESNVTSITSLNANNWYNIVIVYNSFTRNQSIYINGLYENSTISPFQIGSSDMPLRMGTCSETNNFFNGVIDEVVIWNRELTSFEIDRLYLFGRSY